MDFLSRDRQRHAVEELADPTGDAQVRVALRANESARQAAAANGLWDRSAHVGYHLVGAGRHALETALGYRPPILRRGRRLIFRHATAMYLLPIMALTALILAVLARVAVAYGASTPLTLVAVLLWLVPAMDVAISLAQRVITATIPPRRLLRLDFLDRVPEHSRTLVVIPTIFHSPDAVRDMLDHLEVMALGNLDPHIHFGILSDVPDAEAPEMPGDEDIVDAARAGVDDLNTRLGGERGDRFFLFHRERRWNPGEQRWMGWERKRGKLEELNRLLRGATDTSFVTVVGAVGVLPTVRYCITLDSDTRLPRDGAKRLIGIAGHPLNRPRYDVASGRVVEGYGILQPRVSVTLASAAQSLFARTYAGHTGVDPYTTAVSDAYQDLFDEGIFTGKGLYDVDAFAAALKGRVPENALLSHDLFEGLYARTALVTDVEMVDDYPSSVLAHARRQHRWVRGDWQILGWLLPWVTTRAGLERNTLPLIARWKIFDNLRRSLLAPASVAAVAVGVAFLPGPPTLWMAAGLAAVLLPIAIGIAQPLPGRLSRLPLGVQVRSWADDLSATLARALLQVTFMAYEASQMVHAVAITLVRLLTQRRLLEWETFASTAARARTPKIETFFREMIASLAIALGVLLLCLAARPSALVVVLPVVALWVIAPGLAYVLSLPAPETRDELSPADRDYLREIARDTWRYFERYVGSEDNALPPDNVQAVPTETIAHRTSPTNIGMAMLATIAAHDLGFIDAATVAARTAQTLDTLDRLERFEGHFLNWYDTRTLHPLLPRYVSTVDSANMATALMTVAAALEDIAADSPASGAAHLRSLAARASSLAEAMSFRFLYDATRQLFTIGYRLPDPDGPGRRDSSYYDLLASEARTASFLAIAKGEVPESHWFHLGRSVTNVHGAPVLLSWSGTMFEYLMPLLLMRRYPRTLLDESMRHAVVRQREYARQRSIPWGISESAYSVVDRHETYQYKAFGVPGLGLKRGLGDETVVAPYATGLAAMLAPAAAVENFHRLEQIGLRGTYGFFDAIDYTTQDADHEEAAPAPRARHSGEVVRTWMAHHQGMTLVALTNVLLDDVMVRRFHSDRRIGASELLLQERIPRYAPTIEPRPREDVRLHAPLPSLPVRLFRSAETVYPHAQFLSNGSMVSVVTHAGGGHLSCRGLAVTRVARDSTSDGAGHHLYLRDVRSGAVWSPTYLPTLQAPDEYRVELRSDKATFHRRDGDIATRLEVAVSPEDDVEVRRLRIVNNGLRVVELDVTSYAEVVLAPPREDLAHPSFVKLFLETEYVAESAALFCHRRPRDSREAAPSLVHVLNLEGRPHGALEWETDRVLFLGRGRDVSSPRALEGLALSGTTGTTLDPIVSLRQRVRLLPGGSIRLSFATGVAWDRDTARALAHKYGKQNAAPRTFGLALTHAQIGMRHLDISTDDAQLFERLASRALYADESLRAPRATREENELSQSGLWPHAISGDFPILLVRVSEHGIALVRQALQAQEYWRLKGLQADLVILNEHPVGYLDEVQAQLVALLDQGPWRGWRERPSGVYLLRTDRLSRAERTLLHTVARAILSTDRGDLRAHLDHPYEHEVASAQVFDPATLFTRDGTPNHASAGIEAPPLMLENGVGGFSGDGRAYTIVLTGQQTTPLPWANVIANPHFGTIVTESGAASTWAGNSRENRLTPHNPDFAADRTSEAMFLRDDDLGHAWSPTPGPLPRGAGDQFLITHEAGRTQFVRVEGSIRSQLDIGVDVHDPVKICRLTLTNIGGETRHLSLFAYVEWLLGPPQDGQSSHVVTWRDVSGAVFASNRYRESFRDSVAFLAASRPPIAATGSRRVVLGRHGRLSRPAALSYARLQERFGAGLDPCAALQFDITLEPGATDTIAVILGQGDDADGARALVAKHAPLEKASEALAVSQDGWRALLDTVQIKTPDDSFDILLNHWLLYQTTACRLWTRGAYYQPGGAYGFRDQLQDVLALLFARPDLAREHLLRAAGHQFVEGDVQHWWHEPGGRGLRSRCSDDMLWLPYVAAEYVVATGDTGVLDQTVPYIEGPLLEDGEHERYDLARVSTTSDTLYGHCLKAIARGTTGGAHGLPLFGSCDWNDGMNRVGAEGRGESTWLGFFLFDVCMKFAPLCAARGDQAATDRLALESRRLAARLDLAWDGDWYKRGYYDDGSPLGSAQNDECRIDSIAQTWAVISGAAPLPLAERAMDAVRAQLVVRHAKILLLLTPPFDRSAQEPGYIKGYPPGLRENGGQYTHAAAWIVLALATLGNGDEAFELFHMLNPINHSRSPQDRDIYKTEPYVVAGDVYAKSPHAGRGGWSWYTGSAGWLYRVGIEWILGLRRHGDSFTIDPCVPASWRGFTISWRYGTSRYEIAIENPAHVSRGVSEARLDGDTVEAARIPLRDDGRTHHVHVTMGNAVVELWGHDAASAGSRTSPRG